MTHQSPAEQGALRSSDPVVSMATLTLVRRWRMLILVLFLSGAVGYGSSFLMKPIYTSTTVFLSPQQQTASSSALAALGALGALSGLAGATGGGARSPADQYVALMQSVQVSDRIIDQFKLMEIYDEEYRDYARRDLANHVTFTAGKKDNLIRIEVEDTDRQRAAAMANQFVSELRRLTSTLAVTEAQQRRLFFERQLQETKTRLSAAQSQLQSVGFNAGAVKAEPKAAAETYARLKAELTAAEVRLETMRGSLAEQSVELRLQRARVQSLREQVTKLERSQDPVASGDADYIGKYREFKYQETLFDLYARQFELARADESREGVIQVVDVAQPAERKTKPRRKWVAIGFGLAGLAAFAGFLVGRERLQQARLDPQESRRLAELSGALKGR